MSFEPKNVDIDGIKHSRCSTCGEYARRFAFAVLDHKGAVLTLVCLWCSTSGTNRVAEMDLDRNLIVIGYIAQLPGPGDERVVILGGDGLVH